MTTTPWEEKAVRTTDTPTALPAHFGHPEAERRAMCEAAALFPLSPTGMIVVDGEERVNFLSGLITNQIRKVGPQQSIYAGLLTAQGRFLYDFTIVAEGEGFWLLTDAEQANGLLQRLEMYRLRSRIDLRAAPARALLALVGPQADDVVAALFPDLAMDNQPGVTHHLATGNALLWRDPRHAAHGWRLLLDDAALQSLWPRLANTLPLAGEMAWHDYRTLHALPQAGHEWLPDNTLPLEAGFLELNGVDFGKGCYVGQETTTRTHHRGTLRKRLFSLAMATPLAAPPQTPILLEGGKEAGNLTTLASDGMSGLAILRVQDVAEGKPLRCGQVTITATSPPWATWQLN